MRERHRRDDEERERERKERAPYADVVVVDISLRQGCFLHTHSLYLGSPAAPPSQPINCNNTPSQQNKKDSLASDGRSCCCSSDYTLSLSYIYKRGPQKKKRAELLLNLIRTVVRHPKCTARYRLAAKSGEGSEKRENRHYYYYTTSSSRSRGTSKQNTSCNTQLVHVY